MRQVGVSLVVVVAGCRFDLPEIAVSRDVPVGVDASACPDDYAPLTGGNANHVYKKALGNRTWAEQDDYCGTTSGLTYLAVPDDATELTSLHELVGTTVWVGINDRVLEGMYVKSNGGTATFLPWAAGQPDNGGGGINQEDCIAVGFTTIQDVDCTILRAAVCECEL